MKLTQHSHQSAFTLAEILMAMAVAVVIFAGIITASVAMQKSFNAVDHYFATHIQQVRIIDYLNRDVKRALIVTTSPDQQTVTVTIPNYLSSTGTVQTPTISTTTSGYQVNYGTTKSTIVYSISGTAILRTEDTGDGTGPHLTTIASSTDQLVPSTTDADLSNTEYATMAVTFKPIFTSGNVADERTGTTVFSLAYLRNKRRG